MTANTLLLHCCPFSSLLLSSPVLRSPCPVLKIPPWDTGKSWETRGGRLENSKCRLQIMKFAKDGGGKAGEWNEHSRKCLPSADFQQQHMVFWKCNSGISSEKNDFLPRETERKTFYSFQFFLSEQKKHLAYLLVKWEIMCICSLWANSALINWISVTLLDWIELNLAILIGLDIFFSHITELYWFDL